MNKDGHVQGFCCVFLVAVALFVWYVYLRGGGGSSFYKNFPGELAVAGNDAESITAVNLNEWSQVATTLGNSSVLSPDIGYDYVSGNYRQPPYDHQGNVHTPHRYPAHSGGNISLLIHKGWDALMLPAGKDAAWYNCPPSEQEGYSL